MRLVTGLRRLLFVAVSTMVVLFVSERMYWYFAAGPVQQLELLAFYAPAFASVLWLIDRYRISNVHGLMLAVPVFAYLVEGAIVPVLYSGGPLIPFFPALFTFWHGVVGVVLMWYFVRSWLLTERWKPLLATSCLLGAYWGMWAMAAVVEQDDPDFVSDLGRVPEVLDPGGFTRYAFTYSLLLACAHWLLGRVWLTSFMPSRLSRRIWFVVVGAIVAGWTVVIPWAAPMFAVYAGVQLWALRRYEPSPGPTILERLAGTVRIRALWPLAALPMTAALSYSLWWNADLSSAWIENWIFILSSTLQAMAGFGILCRSLWLVGGNRDRSDVEPEPHVVADRPPADAHALASRKATGRPRLG